MPVLYRAVSPMRFELTLSAISGLCFCQLSDGDERSLPGTRTRKTLQSECSDFANLPSRPRAEDEGVDPSGWLPHNGFRIRLTGRSRILLSGGLGSRTPKTCFAPISNRASAHAELVLLCYESRSRGLDDRCSRNRSRRVMNIVLDVSTAMVYRLVHVEHATHTAMAISAVAGSVAPNSLARS